MVPECERTAHILAAGYRTARRHFLIVIVLYGAFLSACSRDETDETVETPPKLTVSTTDINKLLKEGDAANHQLAAQLVRLSLPYGGQLNLELNLSDTKLSDSVPG